MDSDRIKLEDEILDKLSGRIFLLQDISQKNDIVFQTFLELCNLPECQKLFKKIKGLEIESFFREFFSYGIIEEFLEDPEVEDIMINYLSPIYLHKTKQGMIKTDRRFFSREELDLFIKKLIIFSGRTKLKKINNLELVNIKGRVNIIYSPFGYQITITRAKERPLSIIELIEHGSLNCELAAQFWLYVEGLGIKPANVIISGGPGTGKTTFLNALLSFVPSYDRIVVIEDTLELNTSSAENCSRLESDDDISLADLVKNSLRMRPDRVIVGEVRGKEAQDLMTAMNIGKYCMGTLHASSARETIMRLANEPMNVPEILINLVDAFVIMRRYNVKGKMQRVVGELVETGGMEEKKVLLSALWSYDLSRNNFKESAISSIYRDKLAEVSGLTPKDIMNELKVRTQLIRVLSERGIKKINEVTDFCRRYSNNPNSAIEELGLKREDLVKNQNSSSQNFE